jgi:protein-S-isoprenylcysteine O-methyltransferase Ste14
MTTTQQIISACLIIFMFYWSISAGSVKPMQETKGWLAGNWYSILLVTGFLLIANFKFLARIGVPVSTLAMLLIPHSTIINILSVILAVAGLILAVIARRTLAENWSGAVAIKAGHELVTTGLYRYIRHPIYTGVSILASGATLAFGTLGACVGFIIIVLAIVLKSRAEEQILAKHFADEYPAYRKRTKILIPFVW